jgi:hypothetical protein
MTDEIITLLRAAAEQAPLDQSDVAHAQQAGRRIRRRRHLLAGAGSTLTVATVAALVLNLGGSGPGQSVVQGAAPPDGGAVEKTHTVESVEALYSDARNQNLARLRAILGPDGWRTESNDSSDPAFADLGMVAGSREANQLPSGDSAADDVLVRFNGPDVPGCPTPIKNGPPLMPCATDTTPDGQKVAITHSSGQQAARAGTPTSTTHYSTTFTFIRPDGATAIGLIGVDDHSAAPSGAIEKWLAAHKQKLIGAVTDSGMAPDRMPEWASVGGGSGYPTDLPRLRDILGPGWQLTYTTSMGGHKLVSGPPPISGSAAAHGLPAGYQVRAELIRQNADIPSCTAYIQGGVTLDPCRIERAPGGPKVLIQRQHTSLAEAHGLVWDATRVVFTRSDGWKEVVQLAVYDTTAEDTTARQAQAVAWLRAYDAKLIAAATDPAILNAKAG